MLLRRYLLLFILLFCCAKGIAATFVVTSNADSGPGTLRDALTQAAANDMAVKDYINFNLPDTSVSGRTITLQSQLPNVTGNIVIDGSTQPGAPFGVSNTKVVLTAQAVNSIIFLLPIDSTVPASQTIEFYSLYLNGGGNQLLIDGILNYNATMIIGAPGKGDVFCGLFQAVGGNMQNAVIQSSFFGLQPDGRFELQNNSCINGTFGNTLIGGPDAADGNVILSYSNYFAINMSGNPPSGPITIQNNFFDTDYLGKTVFPYDDGLPVYISGAYNVSILDNVFSANYTQVYAEGSASLTIKGNYFGTDRAQTVKFPTGIYGSTIYVTSSSAVIGGTTPADQNIFANYNNPLASQNGKLDVIQNSFYCNQTVVAPNTFNDNYIRVLSIDNTGVSGDAPPGAMVQLYYVSTQCSDCNPDKWFATVTADVNGKWNYSGAVAPQSILVSSTLKGNTVGFQPTSIPDSDLVIVNKDCHHPASVSFKEPRTGRFKTFLINPATGDTTILTPNSVIAPGYYQLKLTQGSSCPVAYSNPFTILDNTPYTKGSSNYLECGNNTAYFVPPITTGQGITATNYYWIDSLGNTVSNQLSPQLTVGKYTFYFKDSNGCFSDTVNFQVLPQPAPPTLDGSHAIVTDASCGLANGSITNVTIKNIPPVGSYAGWFDSSGKFIDYGPDLTNVGPGTYYYSILYDPNCTPLITQNYTIGVKNGVTIDETNAKATPAGCGVNNGSVTGMVVTGATTYQWVDVNGNVVGTNKDLTSSGPGQYKLIASNGTACMASSSYYTINGSFQIDSSKVVITPEDCGDFDGSVTGLNITNNTNAALQYSWQDASGNVLGTGVDLTHVSTGNYTLHVTTADYSCSATYGPVYVPTTTPTAVDLNPKITPADCGQSNGSITNVPVFSPVLPPIITWTNSAGKVVGTDTSLINVPAGTYTRDLTNPAGCGHEDDIFTIPEVNGITIDETKAAATNASCDNGNGSVTGITVTGATNYQWTDVTGKVVGNNIDLTQIFPGTYTLTASNTTGCIKSSKAYTVTEQPSTTFPNYSISIVPTCINSANGSVTIHADAMVTAYRWVNSQGKYAGNEPETANVPADTYTLYLTDVNGCESLYGTYTVPSINPASITTANVQVTNDQCDTKSGSITGLQAQGGIAPYLYRWADANGNTVAKTLDLNGVGAGTYTLTVTDYSVCGPATVTYTIQNNDNAIPAPIVTNLQVCSSGSAMITVINATATDVYDLYDSEDGTTPIDREKGGNFRVNVAGNISFYISRVSGSCESGKSRVDVTVGLSAINIANTFTPNGDGINDYWKINNIENYPQAVVQIFTRSGQKIFESKGYSVPFDGTYKGQPLPSGVYYFIINLNTNCSLLSGSLTLLH